MGAGKTGIWKGAAALIRKAEERDLDGILSLLRQVCRIHAEGRPDLFKNGGVKYTREQLLDLLGDETRPIHVYDGGGQVLGYLFSILEETPETTSLQPVRTLYIDDLCVDASARGRGVGSALSAFALQLAREKGCDRVTLHAWNFNGPAFRFYETLGMTPLVTTMEQRLTPEKEADNR